MAASSTPEEQPTSATETAEELAKVSVSPSGDEEGDSSRRGGGEDNGSSASQSALRANIESKGKNAYYFAHAATPTGPKWDGKPNPKLLGSKSAEELEPAKKAGFDMHKSNITSYAFLDEEKSVKLYITMQGVGEKCTDEDITLDWTETSFCFVINNYEEDEKCLSFGKLSGKITKATYKLKADKIILILKKEKEGVTWHTVNDKGQPDHEIV